MTTLLKLIATIDGKKTYIAALGIALLGVVDIANGETETGIQKIVEAAGLAGLRHGVTKRADA